MTIAALIDKQDTVEIVRDQIGAILTTEVASQMALATAASRDPDDWKLRIFLERSNPWEIFPTKTSDTSPIVNVWWTDSTFERGASNIVERQKSTATFNVDCYGYGVSKATPGGHQCGDQDAAEEVHRAIRLVRNILMAAEYTYLGMQKTVWRRWTSSISIFQPQQDDQNVHQIVGARLSFQVEFSEFSPQVQAETLELLSVDVHRTEDNEIVINADYDYTA